MLLEIILFLILGIFIGTFTGLTPGVHINLIGAILVSLSASVFFGINPLYFVVFIVAMSITHVFVDFIPSIFLGCPDTDTVLSSLPGHILLKNGKGYEAVMLTSYGCLASVFILILIFFPLAMLIPKIYHLINKAIPYLLIIVSLFLIASEKNKFGALFAFVLTGILGLITLNIFNDSDKVLLPLLSGLFGSSMLLISIRNKIKIPKQKMTKPKIKFLKPLTAAVIASPLSVFLPALGSGQIAIIGTTITKTNSKEFLFLLGATNILAMSFSFLALYTISKTRTGSAAAIQQILGSISPRALILILIIIVISGIASFFLVKILVKFASEVIGRTDYTKLSIIILSFLTLMILIFSGIIGLIIFAVSTFTGIYVMLTDVRKTNMMGCLILPTIILYLF